MIIECGKLSRFIGLSGLYLSLRHLSLSDATVLTFLAPVCVVFTGAVFLGESFSRRQVFAGRERI
jgi:drug/metabolite transporter (DMT)-like permease